MPAHRRGTLGGMDAATELTGTYLQRVLRGWAGKGPAANAKDLECAVPSPLAGHAVNPSVEARWRHPCRHTVPQAARTPHQTVCWWFC
ncbi:hypothetical protein XdyCFBP7245_15345 [Xanthomonas dyei]|uniref:Uncharacterized protein n=1 Tax=Xanthomonas dyei TaxID=743699 RepID=A0A2S7C0B6_9XANT|nr:hypothetical protein XdyCFBP7245_15345 [Xanthomonas dyei]